MNEEKNIKRCIKSLMEQSFKNKEILIADNGSIDKTWIICDSLKKIFSNEYEEYFEE